MKLRELRDLATMSPQQRALQCLELGDELQKTRTKRQPKKGLPTALNRKVVRDSVAGPLIARLYGMQADVPRKTKGLRETGRTLNTKGGKVADMVLTWHARKSLIETSMKQRRRDRSVSDLAVRQLALSMFDSDPLTRCCAAYAYWQATGSDAGVPILESATESQDEDEYLLAAYSLAKMDKPQAKRLQGTARDDRPQTPPQTLRKSMTVIIHGTFAKDRPWYQPGGDFHEYIRTKVYPDVYSGPNDFFKWSGRYAVTEVRRRRIWRQAAKKLLAWVKAHPATTLRLIAHSHGNTVVNMATEMGMQACTLIQLSPSVRKDILPDMPRVSSDVFFNIHSAIDLIVKIDRGSQTYQGTSVAWAERHRTISPFGHSDSHDPKKWAKKKMPAFVRSVCP